MISPANRVWADRPVDDRWRRSPPGIYATAVVVHPWMVIYRSVPVASTPGRIATPAGDPRHWRSYPGDRADRGLFQVAVTVGDLEAFAIQTDGAVTTALLTLYGTPEGLAQALTVRAVTPDIRGIEKAP